MSYMATQLDDVRARLKRAAAARKRAEAALESSRDELATLIVEASDAGMRQVEIVQISEYNREHIRRIVLAAREAEPDHDGSPPA